VRRPHLSTLLRWVSLLVLLTVAILIVWNFRLPDAPETVSIPVETDPPVSPASGSEPPPPGAESPVDSTADAIPADVVEESVGFEAEGTRGDTRSFLLRAARTQTLREETMRLEEVELEIFQGAGAGLRIESVEGTYRVGAEEVEFRGDVRVWRDGERILVTDSLEYRQDPERLESPAPVDFTTGELIGHGAGLRYFPAADRLEIDGPVFFRYRPPSDEEPVHGRCWRLAYLPGEGNAFLSGDALLRQAGATLRGWDIALLRSLRTGDPSRLTARSAVHLRQTPEGPGSAAEGWSDRLDAVMEPGEAMRLAEIELQGEFRGIAGGRRARGATARYRFESAQGRLEAGGGGGPGAELQVPGRRVRAERIEIFGGGSRLEAAGDVETVLQGDARTAAEMPFPFDAGDPITVHSGRLESTADGTRAVFSGGVIAWQGERQIQAGRIEVEDERMQAHGEVLTRFPVDGRDPDAGGGDNGHVTIRSDRMSYGHAERLARYTGEARMDRGTASTTSGLIIAELGGPGAGIERLILEERVTLRLGERTGTADRGVFLPREDILILTRDEGFVELTDPVEGRSLRSRELTLNLSDDSMKAETGKKGRLWMTLTPGRGETDSIDAGIGD
jgi:lipopolysaccharide export system protein LptA